MADSYNTPGGIPSQIEGATRLLTTVRRSVVRPVLVATTLLAALGALGGEPGADDLMTVKRLAPVLFVEEIEPALPFWEERLGFARTAEVPDGERLGFVLLERDGIQVMYQTRRSMAADIPAVAQTQPTGAAFIFIEVENVDAFDDALGGIERVLPRRTTDYGADEVVVREPGGNIVVFAQFGD